MKILVVDDSPLYLSMVSKYLDEIENVSEVILSSKPEEVIGIIEEELIDIVIMDVIMPKLSGFDLLKIIRSEPKYNDMHIIMFTSLNDLESYKKCYELGASDFITKPINVIEFHARLKVAIKSKHSSNEYKRLILVTQQQNQELKEINAKLTDTKFHLVQSEKMAAIGQLSAGIAHEINNPMGFVSSNFEILEKYYDRISQFLNYSKESMQSLGALNTPNINEYISSYYEKYKALKLDIIMDELKGILSDSQSGLQRISAIVQSLRVFARSVEDDEKDTYILQDIIKQVLLISNNEIKYVANLSLSVPDNLVIYCNKVQIGQVFINVLVNAAQAIKGQEKNVMGNISIIAKKKDDYVYVHFIDDGPGIPIESQLKIFDPFFTTKEIGQGTGLGLSISYDIIVNKHGGSIDLKSEEGKGTEFTIKLPIYNLSDKEEPYNV